MSKAGVLGTGKNNTEPKTLCKRDEHKKKDDECHGRTGGPIFVLSNLWSTQNADISLVLCGGCTAYHKKKKFIAVPIATNLEIIPGTLKKRFLIVAILARVALIDSLKSTPLQGTLLQPQVPSVTLARFSTREKRHVTIVSADATGAKIEGGGRHIHS